VRKGEQGRETSNTKGGGKESTTVTQIFSTSKGKEVLEIPFTPRREGGGSL